MVFDDVMIMAGRLVVVCVVQLTVVVVAVNATSFQAADVIAPQQQQQPCVSASNKMCSVHTGAQAGCVHKLYTITETG